MTTPNKYVVRLKSLLVAPEGDRMFSELVTEIYIEDEAAGEFVEVKQERGHIAINPEEWPTIRRAINRLVKECREDIDHG